MTCSGEYAQLASEGRFSVPVVRTFSARRLAYGRRTEPIRTARGKLVLQIGQPG